MKHKLTVRGFTLIELLMTIALLGIVTTLATPSVRTMLANQAVSATSSDLLSDLMQARSIAMAKNSTVAVQSIDGAWEKGWTIYVDKNKNGAFDSGADTLIFTKDPFTSSVSIDSANTNKQIFSYESSGFLVSGGGNGSIALKSNETSRKRRIIVESAGRPRICDPDRETC